MKHVKGANKEKLKELAVRIKEDISPEEKALSELIELLEEEKVEDILNNKDKFSKLFIAEEEEVNREETKMLIKASDEG